ncbi:ParB/RepB/Spo0J family partition protein [Sporomusa acidovorans]|uniref:ParB/RepB/Spo0J family partition protein n=1 Tax=Sporomusa acidovorans TaxID=112900 RepID=UPI00088C8518|nr:ParB N-terminal domain-containing protein [Sporomusa acidovorans]OZC18932.1 nucleoid occlusion protein [Sporomusa acidovorans DSM 3132]SDD69548.1 Chromosome segregation protein Spo0J, contains ParB-like nuclease domain [Sporomusa acidovorans]
MAKKLDMNAYFNRASQSPEILPERTHLLDMSALVENKQNFYSIADIEVLAADILRNGIRQPLEVVMQQDGVTYRLISGHRRLAALKYLKAQGEAIPEKVPCIIRRYESEADEIEAIISANCQRDKTIEDELNELKYLQPIIRRRFEEEKPGGKFRAYFARQLGVSESTLKRKLELLKLSPALLNRLKQGKLPLSAAYELTGLSPEEQEEAEYALPEEGSVQAAIEVKEEIRAQKPLAVAREEAAGEEELTVEGETAGTPDSKKSRKKPSPKAENSSQEEPGGVSPIHANQPLPNDLPEQFAAAVSEEDEVDGMAKEQIETADFHSLSVQIQKKSILWVADFCRNHMQQTAERLVEEKDTSKQTVGRIAVWKELLSHLDSLEKNIVG